MLAYQKRRISWNLFLGITDAKIGVWRIGSLDQYDAIDGFWTKPVRSCNPMKCCMAVLSTGTHPLRRECGLIGPLSLAAARVCAAYLLVSVTK